MIAGWRAARVLKHWQREGGESEPYFELKFPVYGENTGKQLIWNSKYVY
jgi:hypothetical protein